MIDAFTLSLAYYHMQKIEVTEHTTSHDRHTKWPNHTESDPDGEDDLHHGAGGGMQITSLYQNEDQVEVVHRQTRP